MKIEKIRYRLVYNRRNNLNRQGEALVQIEAYLNRRKLYISTNTYLSPRCWDKTTSQVVNHPQANDLNAMLYEKIIELQGIEIGFWRRGVSPSLLDLKNAIRDGMTSADTTFCKFAEKVIEHSSRRDGTKGNLLATVRNIRKWRGDVDFKDLTFNYITDYENYLREQGTKTNTIGKHLRNLRTLVNEAINRGYISRDNYPFLQYKIKKEKPEHRVLTRTELTKLEKHQPKRKTAQRVLDAFLFCCYTGLRFSDFKQLSAEHIVTIRNQKWIDFTSVKTNIHQRIPIEMLNGGKAIGIMSKYENVEKLAHIGCNADTNRVLKEICTQVGIDKRVTFHVARHTFATQLLYDGVNITTVQKLLGHTSVKTTQIYSEVLDDTLIKDLQGVRKRRRETDKSR